MVEVMKDFFVTERIGSAQHGNAIELAAYMVMEEDHDEPETMHNMGGEIQPPGGR